MTGDTPDYRPFLAGRVRRHRLAQAAASHPAPVHLCTGHFAPPNVHAVWHLVTPAQHVLRLVWCEDTGDVPVGILPDGDA